jgi:aminomethyltransferase
MRLYGNDMDTSTNPFEAGLDWAVDLDKEFVGVEPLRRVKDQGLRRTLVGLRMLDRNIPRHGYRVTRAGEAIGVIASGNVSFTLGFNIGTAYVPPTASPAGTSLEVEVRGTAAPAQVVPLPFYSRRRQSG